MSTRVGLTMLAVVLAIEAAFYGVVEFVRAPIDDALLAIPVTDFDASAPLRAQLELIAKFSMFTGLAFRILILAGIALFAWRARGRAAAIAWMSFGLLSLAFVLSATSLTLLRTSHAFETIGLVFLASTLTTHAGLGVLVAAAAQPLDSAPLRLGATLGYALLALMLASFAVWHQFFFDFERDRAILEVLDWPWRLVAIGTRLLMIAVVVWSAIKGKSIAEPEASAPSSAVQIPGAGAALRLLGWALLSRIGVTVVSAIAIGAGVAGVEIGELVVLATVASTLTGIAMLVSLARQYTWPHYARAGGALGWALGSLVIALLLDAWVGISASELIGLANRARSATSFWGMPSFSRIEELQAIVVWAGHVAQLCGMFCTAAIAISLGRTAAYLEHESAGSSARVALAMCITGGLTAMLVAFLVTVRGMLPLVIPLALIVLGLAITFLVAFLRATFTLARAMDEAPPD